MNLSIYSEEDQKKLEEAIEKIKEKLKDKDLDSDKYLNPVHIENTVYIETLKRGK
jgi:hypothetical protein